MDKELLKLMKQYEKKLKEAEKIMDTVRANLPSSDSGYYTTKSFRINLNLAKTINWSEFKKAKDLIIRL